MSVEVLEDILDGVCKDGKLIQDEISSHGRWNTIRRIIVQYKDKFYQTCYQVGNTECQDCAKWFERYADETEVLEVKPTKSLVTEYVPVNENVMTLSKLCETIYSEMDDEKRDDFIDSVGGIEIGYRAWELHTNKLGG